MKSLVVLGLVFLSLSFSAAAQDGHAHEAPGKTPSITELMVEVDDGKSLRLGVADLAKLPRKQLRAKGHDGIESTYSGIELREILQLGGAKLAAALRGKALTQFLLAEAADGYRAVFALPELDPEFTDRLIILADLRDGRPLAETSGPWQIVVQAEKKHGRWVRQVTSLKVRVAK